MDSFKRDIRFPPNSAGRLGGFTVVRFRLPDRRCRQFRLDRCSRGLAGDYVMTTTTKPSRLREAIAESAEGMHRTGIMSDASYRVITVRQFARTSPPSSPRT